MKIKEFVGLGEVISEFGIAAKSINMDKIPVYEAPKQIRDELVTMNQHGYMKFEWDEFGKDFAEYAMKTENPVLEIGPAYGWLTHRIMEKNKEIIAADICREHLEVLLREAPQDKLEKLHICNARFPDEMDFKKESLGVIIASRVFHFLRGEVIEAGLDKIHQWLEPNGIFICTNCSIYHYSVKEKLLPVYKERAARGDEWPGVVENQREFSPQHAPYTQDFLNVFDIPQLEVLLPKFGFEIEKIKLFDYPSDNYSENKEGHVGFVARKINN